MAQQQRETIATAITGLMTGGETAANLCCTVEASNAAGEDVSIQVMQGTINIAPYTHDEEPLEQLESCGALEGLDDQELDVQEWEPGSFATLGFGGLATAEVAQLVDQIFVKLLGCDDAGYTPAASTEDLG